MKRRVLLRYLSGHYLANAVGSILGLTALIELLNLLNNTTDVLDRKLGLSGLGTYLMLQMPAALDQAITLGILIGGVITFTQATRRNEIMAIRSAGITVYQIGILLLPCAALFALLHYGLSDQLVPRSTRAMAVWWQSTTPPGDDDEKAKDKTLWFQAGKDFVAIDRMADGGRLLDGVHLYRRDGRGSIVERTTAQQADYADGQWTLKGVAMTSVSPHGIVAQKNQDSEPWNLQLGPTDIIQLGTPAARLSTQASRSALNGSRAANRAPSFYEMQIQETYASALAAFIMLLLSLPVAFSSSRDGRGGRLTMICLALGLLYLLSNGVLDAFGESGALPPLMATWAAFIIFAMAGCALLLNLEDQ